MPSSTNTPSTCISSRVPLHFKFCLLLCLFGIFVIYRSIYSASMENVFDKNGTFLWASSRYIKTKPENFVKIKNDWSRMCAGRVTEEQFSKLFPPLSEDNRKYVMADWGGLCGGLGNQIWRFASLYGIGKPYGRRPIFKEDQRCLKEHGPHESEGENEMETLFPIYASQMKFIRPIPNETHDLGGFAGDCCKYDDPQRVHFSRFKEKYVQIQSYYFQSYKFFESRRQEIRQIFQFAPTVCSAVESYQEELFSYDGAHKLCVHTRIEDFQQFGFDSKKEFTEKGIAFAHNMLKKAFGVVSIVLMGAEKHFLTNLTIDREAIHTVYLPKAMPRGNDLAFATVACDSLLITAPASTFSWWMAYLMPNHAIIFYDSELEHTPYTRENFLPEWTPIKLVNGTIILD